MARFYPKKITLKTIGLTKEKIVSGLKEDKVKIARIYGRIEKSEEKETQIGPYSLFTGEFEALNYIDQTTHRARRMILPEIGQDVCNDFLNSSDGSIEFGIDIIAEKNETASVGYSFSVSPLVEPDAETDTLSQLAKKFNAIEDKTNQQTSKTKGKK